MKIQFFLLISLLFVDINAVIERDESVIVSAKDGKLRGSIKKSRNSRDYFAFQGVKYAKISERFQPAVQTEPWTGIKEAIDVGSECPQVGLMSPTIVPNSEDCLFLNVYTPDLTPTRNDLPVMVWIHGGAFCYGSGSQYGPDYFMDEDVILVTINYRLSSLGFLNTGDGVVSGNAALRDIIMALKWVQRNIQDFNGDPKRVTIFGESAGGIAVNTLMISPAAEGLFHRAIAQSGTSLNQLTFMPNPAKSAKIFAEKLGCPTCCSKKMVECLQNKDLAELLEVERSLIMARMGFAKFVFGPSIDSVPAKATNNGAERILPESPYELIKQGAGSGIPTIIGTTETEFAYMKFILLTNETFVKELNSNWVNILSEILDYTYWVPEDKLEEIGNDLREIYFNSKDLSAENIDNYGKMSDQFMMARTIILAAELHAQKNPQVFPYVFTQRGKFSMVNVMGLKTGAPVHGDEVQYLFNYYTSSNPPMWPEFENESDIEFSKKMVKLWTSFAASGKPSSILGLDWKPVGINTPLGTDLPWYAIDANPKYFKFSEEYKDKLAKMDALLSKYENPPVSWRTVEKSNHQEL